MHFVILCIFDDIQRQGLIYIDHFIFVCGIVLFIHFFYNLCIFCIENQRLYHIYIYIVVGQRSHLQMGTCRCVHIYDVLKKPL